MHTHRLVAVGACFLAAMIGSASMASALSFFGPKTIGASHRLVTPAHSKIFLGCVRSRHHCSHIAHDNGFYTHWIKHNHYVCPRSPGYACYALSPD